MSEQLPPVEAPDEDDCYAPAHRRERQPGARDPHQRNDAVAAMSQTLPDGWVARWVFAEQDGATVVRSLAIEPEDVSTPPGGLNADSLRNLSPAKAKIAANAALKAANREVSDFNQPISPEAHALIRARSEVAFRSPKRGRQPTRARKPGRPRLSDDFLAATALAYLDELGAGSGLLERVTKRVAPLRGLEPHQVTPQATKDWVRAARERGFLTDDAKQGQRGGQAGGALIEYLEQLERDAEGE